MYGNGFQGSHVEVVTSQASQWSKSQSLYCTELWHQDVACLFQLGPELRLGGGGGGEGGREGEREPWARD